ncbi:hypothetical protein ACZ90_36785 [Streptomyces albus subsp. albus]|nr:hypothetical protein ACZ90_36785 [Streptomyces albus subsp. albus]
MMYRASLLKELTHSRSPLQQVCLRLAISNMGDDRNQLIVRKIGQFVLIFTPDVHCHQEVEVVLGNFCSLTSSLFLHRRKQRLTLRLALLRRRPFILGIHRNNQRRRGSVQKPDVTYPPADSRRNAVSSNQLRANLRPFAALHPHLLGVRKPEFGKQARDVNKFSLTLD